MTCRVPQCRALIAFRSNFNTTTLSKENKSRYPAFLFSRGLAVSMGSVGKSGLGSMFYGAHRPEFGVLRGSRCPWRHWVW